jgi:hypothetical protein
LAVAQKWFPQGLVWDKPIQAETIAWLARLDADSIKRVLGKVQWGWSLSDPKSMAAFLAASGSEQLPASAYSTLAQQLVRIRSEMGSEIGTDPGSEMTIDMF